MNTPPNALAPALDCRDLREVDAYLVRWLLDDALPLWDAVGVDRTAGGYFETLSLPSQPSQAPQAQGALRRGRVVARQAYAFGVGRDLGWQNPRSDPVRHGCAYLFEHMYAGDGVFHTAVAGVDGTPQGAFSLYEYAFYLFALARLREAWGREFPIDQTAQDTLRRLRTHWSHPTAGFEESHPPSVPLKSNPHMHLLESALAWLEVAPAAQQAPWSTLADALVELCLNRFIDPRSGALREYFDAEWRPMDSELGRIVEPGHQFEWAWLLLRWSQTSHAGLARRTCRQAALRLIDIAEIHGVDPNRGVAINELWDDFSVKDAQAKPWPQTERLKAWCALHALADNDEQRERAVRGAMAAAQGLHRFIAPAPRGLWQELMREDAGFVEQPCRASSLYHIVCAIETLHQTVWGPRPAPPSHHP